MHVVNIQVKGKAGYTELLEGTHEECEKVYNTYAPSKPGTYIVYIMRNAEYPYSGYMVATNTEKEITVA